MTYKLTFDKGAAREWRKLTPDARKQFQTKLLERLEFPCVPSAALSGMQDCYKIKLKALGYRLVYRVYNKTLIIEVIAIGERDKLSVYEKAKERMH